MARSKSDLDFYAFAEAVEPLDDEPEGASEVRFDVIPAELARRLLSSDQVDFQEVGGQALVVDGLNGIVEDTWYGISLGGKIPGELFNLLSNDPPQPLLLDEPRRLDVETASALSTKFSLEAFSRGGPASWRAKLRDLPPVKKVVAYDVGQGNAAALLSANEEPLAFVDIGAGCARNARTYRRSSTPVDFANKAPVILTHWDMDHYAMALKETAAMDRAWLAPRQKVGPTPIRIASQVRSLHTWSQRPSIFIVGASCQLFVDRPNTKGSRNDSGLIVSVRLECGSVLFTGDMSYQVARTSYLGDDAEALMATHHGSAHRTGTPPRSVDGLVIYSYGLDNSYGHPSKKSLIGHFEEGWERRLDTTLGDVRISDCCHNHHRRCRCCGLRAEVL